MTGVILNLLKQDDFFNISEEIEIAKGKNKLPTSFKGVFKQAKRASKFK